MGIEWLIGTTCTRVFEGYPQNFTFEFGAGSLAVDCLWRLIERGRLRWTSGDHGHKYGLLEPVNAYSEAETMLLGRRVTTSRMREGTSDLILEFEGEIQLEILNDSSGYEPWKFSAPGTLVVALGGGGYSEW